MKDKELFKELAQRGVLDVEIAEKILREAETSGMSAEELLYEKRLVDEVAVAKIKAVVLKAPYKKIDASSIPDELLKLIPKETSQNYRIVPIEKKDNLLVVGMLNPDDERAQEILRFIAKRERVSLGVYIVTPTDLARVWRRYLPYHDEIDAALREINIKQLEAERPVLLDEGMRTTEDAPIIKIVSSTLRNAVENFASDIHIEPQRKYLRIRFRIDGELKETASLPAAIGQPVVARVKVLASLRLDETRMPQDGRFRTLISNREIDFRVSSFPTPSGEKITLRVLDSLSGLKGLKEIGLGDYHTPILEEAINAPFGMILVSGPTGSGKSTTLYAAMRGINSETLNVLTLEDPVEYFMPGVNQSQVKPEIGYTFASGLRQILRQDPDVIMVGEIRDSETASLAVNAALTGHVMLSTIHTNNSIGVIPRLADLGVPGFLLPSALNVMIAQRLIVRLCKECRKPSEATAEAQEFIKKNLEKLPKGIRESIQSKYGKGPYKVYHPGQNSDCVVCKGKGTAGRVGIFEVFKMTKELGDLISAGFTERKLLDEAERQEMITLRQDGIIKALSGEVLIEEVFRETE